MQSIKGCFSAAFALRCGQDMKVTTETGSRVASCRLVSRRGRTMLRMAQDSARMRQDTLLCPCTSELYEKLRYPGHRSCTSNLHEAM